MKEPPSPARTARRIIVAILMIVMGLGTFAWVLFTHVVGYRSVGYIVLAVIFVGLGHVCLMADGRVR